MTKAKKPGSTTSLYTSAKTKRQIDVLRKYYDESMSRLIARLIEQAYNRVESKR